MTSANGVISEPYVRGVVYCAGNAVYGHPCVAPILDITNSTSQVMTINYASRATGVYLHEASRAILQPGEKTLITNMLPGNSGGLGGHVSYLAVALGTGPFDLYALVFFPARGYALVPASARFTVDSTGAVLRVADVPTTCSTPTVGVFPLQYSGCAAPKWPWTLVYTAAIGLQGACVNRNPVLPCAGLTDWALATTAP